MKETYIHLGFLLFIILELTITFYLHIDIESIIDYFKFIIFGGGWLTMHIITQIIVAWFIVDFIFLIMRLIYLIAFEPPVCIPLNADVIWDTVENEIPLPTKQQNIITNPIQSLFVMMYKKIQ